MRKFKKNNISNELRNKYLNLLIILVILLFLVIIFFIRPSNYLSIYQSKFSTHDKIPSEEEREKFLAYISSSTGNWEDTYEIPIWQGKPVINLPNKIEQFTALTRVLGESTTADDGSEKWINISLDDMKLWAMEGERVVWEMPISSGRQGYQTPRGSYRIWRKTRYQRYLSRNPNNYYNLPNVPCSMFFKGGYAIHGAYWHNDFGKVNRSSGCINLSPSDACMLYYWAGPDTNGKNAVNASSSNPGVRVVIY